MVGKPRIPDAVFNLRRDSFDRRQHEQDDSIEDRHLRPQQSEQFRAPAESEVSPPSRRRRKIEEQFFGA